MSEPFVKNAADEAQVKAAGQKENNARKRDLDDVRFILSERRGRRFFLKTIESCGVFTQVFTRGSEGETAFKDGKRVVGLKLLELVNDAAPDAYALMLKEGREDG